jgi:NAD(P)-dependent dehydrogenase (short-subunit alcohol dehydrogenase family)
MGNGGEKMKIALVTGANGGFGKLIAIELIRAGYDVIATMRSKDNGIKLEEAVRLLQFEKQLHVVEMDVTNETQVSSVRKWVSQNFPRIDVLINNAGYSQGGFITDLSIEEWKQQYDTNVLGVIRATKFFLPLIRESTNGKIINISSVSGYFGFPGMGPYCSSKFAVEGLSESLRLELLRDNIFVSLVEPASYRTGIWEKGLEIGADIKEEDTLKKKAFEFAKQAYHNAGDPLEVAQLVRKICVAKRPKLRYQVGKGARSLWFIRKLVPWFLVEKIVMRRLG